MSEQKYRLKLIRTVDNLSMVNRIFGGVDKFEKLLFVRDVGVYRVTGDYSFVINITRILKATPINNHTNVSCCGFEFNL